MLSLFPTLLNWHYFAPLPLRLALGIFLLSHAYRHLHGERAASIESLSSRLGTMAAFSIWYMGLVELGAGLSLLFGFLTQLGAILAIIVALQMMFVRRHAPNHFSHHDTVYLFILMMALSLLVAGPGPLAFDLPL